MAAASAGEPSSTMDFDDRSTKEKRTKRDRTALEEITNFERKNPTDMELKQKNEMGLTKDTYRSKLLSGNYVPDDDTMEDRDTPPNDVDSDDDSLEEDLNGPCILLTKEDKKRIRSPWKNTLLVKLLGRNIGYNYLCNRVKRMWSLVGEFQAVDLENGYYCFRFNNEMDFNHVLLGGPWVIADHYLTIRRWTPYFRSEEATISSVAAWVRFPGMPLEFYDNEVLMKMGNTIGKALMIDRNTIAALRGRYARMCIEVDLTKPLVPKIFIGGRWQRVEYEGLGMLCFECGKFGHVRDQCYMNKKEDNTTTTKGDTRTTAEESPQQQLDELSNYGPWMIATRRTRQPRADGTSKQRSQPDGQGRGGKMKNTEGSRFTILSDANETNEIEDSVPNPLPPVTKVHEKVKQRNASSNYSSEIFKKDLQASAAVSNKWIPRKDNNNKSTTNLPELRIATSTEVHNLMPEKSTTILGKQTHVSPMHCDLHTMHVERLDATNSASLKEKPPDSSTDKIPEETKERGGHITFANPIISEAEMDIEDNEAADVQDY
ncbi:hypothetical protein REPUB_Repub04eG0204400 [Reevesia pubescens]